VDYIADVRVGGEADAHCAASLSRLLVRAGVSAISSERSNSREMVKTMASKLITPSLAGAMVALTPVVAFAHTGVGDTSGFVYGFGHPISGLDHILAMLMVGVFAWQLGGRALYLLPLTFVSVMAVSGTLGIAGIEIPFVETGIALSVVVLGAIVAFDVKAPAAAAIGVVGLFALFHGHTHGAEIPEDAGGLAYAAGFMIAAALLHFSGIGAGFLMGKASEDYGSVLVRSAGGLATVAGVVLVVGGL
jgi:urease accessory protein